MNKICLKNKSPLGVIIAKALIQKRKKQKYLAQKLKVSEGAISHILQGRYIPSIKDMYIISDVLDISIFEMLDAIRREQEK